jgi:hypothetical protein
MISSIKQWIGYTLVSLILGFILGFILIWSWSLFRVFFLGYGDSGPSWISTINDIIFLSGLIIALVGGQLLFFFNQRVSFFSEKHFKKRIKQGEKGH